MGRGYGQEHVYKRPLLSVCMIARDEERWIGRALASVAEVADDLVVVDTGSADATAAIAQAHGARVFHIPWEGDFAKARNHALERARGQWILVLDADEYLHPEDKNKLRKLVQRAPVDVAAFTVTELNLASENPEDVQDQFSPIRLFRNTPYHRFRGRVHEQIAATLRGRLSVSDVRILHTGYLADVVETKQKPRRNVSLLLKALDEINSEDLHRYYLETQLGSEYTRLGEWEKAVEHYEKAFHGFGKVVGNPLNGDYLSVLLSGYVQVLLRQGYVGTAWEVVEEAARLGFSLPTLWFTRGWVELVRGQWAEGVRDLLYFHALLDAGKAKGGYASRQQAEQVWLLASQAMWHQGNQAMAAALVVKGMELWPRSRTLATRVAEVVALVPGLAEFFALRLPPAGLEGAVEVALERGWVAIAQGLASAALPRDPDLSQLLGARVLAFRGELGAAREALLRVLPHGPWGARAQALLSELVQRSA